MKIGILTFHHNNNFGAVLQAIGLTEYLRSLGFNAEVIDFRPPETILSLKGLSFLQTIKRIVSIALFILPHRVSMYQFNKFRAQFLKKSIPFYKIEQMPTDYDVYIIGSDQVWNSKILNHKVYKLYQGEFDRKLGTKLIAYAASAGNGEELLEQSSVFARNICKYDAISVRESTLQELLDKRFNIRAELVIDPTLLVDRKIWYAMATKKAFKPYVLVFLVNRCTEARKIIKKVKQFAQENDLEVKFIPIGHGLKDYKWYRFYSPLDFLTLFFNASFVITTSFHGCCFSMIYEKSFYFLSFNDTNENRAKNLLNITGLNDRIITLNSKIILKDIGYKSVYEKLAVHQNISCSYLRKNFADF